MKTTFLLTLVALLTLLANSSRVGAQGTDFTYQGRLLENGAPANGSFDLQFLLYDALDGGIQQGVTLLRAGVAVSNGLFTTTLDFGAGIFDGPARWLEIRVSPANAGNTATLTPRQALTPAPYAIYASNAGSAATATSLPWAALTGVPGGLADGVDNDTVYSAGAGLTLAGNQFSLNSAFTDARYWKLTGNAGTTPGVNFLGTTDNQALELKVNNLRVLRLEPDAEGPNVIGGFSGNFSAPGVRAAVIAGGGASVHPDPGLGGTAPNAVQANYSTIGGGADNRVAGERSTVSGGSENRIFQGATSAVISGGTGNHIENDAVGSAIGGGIDNAIRRGTTSSVVAGGLMNVIYSKALAAVLTGGSHNEIHEDADYTVIGGGLFNDIHTNATEATIAGGNSNTIEANARATTIGGGSANLIHTNSDYATIPGGRNARASNYGQFAYASGRFGSNGDAQTSLYVLRRTTTSASTNELFLDGSSLRMRVPTDGVWSFDILIVGSSGNDYAGYHIRGLIVNFSGLVGLAGIPVKTLLYEGDPTWDANVDEDIPNSALVIKVRGAAGTTIRWVATVRTAEVIF